MSDLSCESGGDRTEPGGTGFLCDKGGPAAGPWPHGSFPPLPRKTTVKELLIMKRQQNNCFLDEKAANSSPELHSRAAPPSPVTLFQWQIQQEEQRVAGPAADLLGEQDADGDTVLHIAVAQGKRALAYVLAPKMAERGVLDVKERNGQTALQIAAATNNHLIVRDLLMHGANVNAHDHWGRSPLHVCAQKGHVLSLQAIWKTLQRTRQQLDIEMYNYDGVTALHAASMSHNAVVKELRDLKNLCTYRSAELEQRRQTCAATVKILLLMGASVGTKDLKSGRTSLHVAAEEANVELLLLLLDCSSSVAAINATAFDGNTALHMVGALRNSRSQAAAAKLLLTRGADPSLRNLENELPWQLAPEGPPGEKVPTLAPPRHGRAARPDPHVRVFQVRRLLKGKRFQR